MRTSRVSARRVAGICLPAFILCYLMMSLKTQRTKRTGVIVFIAARYSGMAVRTWASALPHLAGVSI